MSDRRSFLTAAGLAALGVATGLDVIGCSASTPTASQPASSSGGSGDAGTTVAVADVPVGGGVVAGAFIVTQPTAGTFKAYSNVCPHQGCAVTGIKGAQATCPCHGSVYSLVDGSRISGPTPSGLGAARASLSGTTVTVTP